MADNTHSYYRKRVSVVLLAAGTSSRMGEPNKLLLNIGKQTLIERTLETLLAHQFTEYVVVTGYDTERVTELLKPSGLNVVFNNDYQEGQMTSVHAGMKALSKPTDGVMIFLADLALIDAQDLDQLRRAFDLCETGVVVPTFQGQRGNPIILSYEQRDDIVAGDKNLGCKKLIQKHPELVTSVEMNRDHVIVDMDTPDAYQSVLQRLQVTSKPTQTSPTKSEETA